MNYFEFYTLPIKFSIDKVALRQKFLELSKKYHPDFFAHESEEFRSNILANSTLNNTAFKTLSHDSLRVRYVLELMGVITETEKEVLPQDFLLEMMELNETIMEMDKSELIGMKANIALMEATLQAVLAQASDRYDSLGDAAQLQQIKTIYLKQKYLLRIKESMLKFASL